MSNGHAGLPADLPSELMDTDPFDIGLDHNEPAPDENRKETAYEEIMGIDGDAMRGGGPKALGDRLVAFREWLSSEAQAVVHPHVCIVNGLATDGTKNAPVLMTAASQTTSTASSSSKGNATQASGRCGMVDGELDQALYDRTMGCQVRASREIRQDEVWLTLPRSAMVTPDLVACSDAGRAVLACIEPAPDGSTTDYWDAFENTGVSEKRHADRVGMTNGTNLLVKILMERKKAETIAAKSLGLLDEKIVQVGGYQARGRRKAALPYKLAPRKIISTRAPVLAFLIHQRFANDVSPAVVGDSLDIGEELEDDEVRNALCGSQRITQPPGSPSTFGPYARTLPSAVSLPICWKRNELALLAGCIPGLAPLQEVAATTLQLASEFAAIAEAGIMHRFPSIFPRGLITWERWVWAASVFASRILPVGLYLNMGESSVDEHEPFDPLLFQSAGHVWEELGVMVPLMDMCNHEIEAAQVTWEPCVADHDKTGKESHPPRAIAHKKVKKGAQIYTNYGLKSNQDLICSYGFGQMSNESDNVKLGWCLADGIGNVGAPSDYTFPFAEFESVSTVVKVEDSTEISMSQQPLLSDKDRIFESTDTEKLNMWWNETRLTILEKEAMLPAPVFESLKCGKKMITAAFGDGSYDPLLLSSVVVATMSSASVRSYQTKNADDSSGLSLTRRHQEVIRQYMIYFFSRKMEKLLENLNNGLKAHYPNINLWTKASNGGLHYHPSDDMKSDGSAFMGWQTFFDLNAYSMSMEVEKRYYSMGTDSCVLTFYDGQLRALQVAIDGLSTREQFENGVLRQLRDLDYSLLIADDEANAPPSDNDVKVEEDKNGLPNGSEKPKEHGNDGDDKKDNKEKSKSSKKRKKKSGGGGGGGGDRPPALKLHIGNLAYTTVTADLFDFFANMYGRQNILECHIPTERGSERSRGFGFVTLPENIAMDIVQSGRKHDLNGRILKISTSNSTGAANRKGGGGGGVGVGGGVSNVSNNAMPNDRCARCGYRPKYCVCPVPDLPGYNGGGRSYPDDMRPPDHGDQHIREPELDYYGATHRRERGRDSHSLSPSHRGRDRDYDRYDRDHRHRRSRSYSRGRDSRERRRDRDRRDSGRPGDYSRERSWDRDRRIRSDRDREGRRGSRYSRSRSRSLSSDGSRSYSVPRSSRRDRRGTDTNGVDRARVRSPSHSASPANPSRSGVGPERKRSRSRERDRGRSSRRKRSKKEGRKRTARSRSPAESPPRNENDK
jgi:hypothetical protein